MELQQAIIIPRAGYARLALVPGAEDKRVKGTSGVDVIRGEVLVLDVPTPDGIAIVAGEPGRLRKFVKESEENPEVLIVAESDDPKVTAPAPRRVFIAEKITDILSKLPEISSPTVSVYSSLEVISNVRGVRAFDDPNLLG